MDGAIRDLDEDDPLVKAVIEEVSRRNLRKEDSDPKPLPPHANGSTGGGLPATEVLDLTAQAVSTS